MMDLLGFMSKITENLPLYIGPVKEAKSRIIYFSAQYCEIPDIWERIQDYRCKIAPSQKILLNFEVGTQIMKHPVY